MTDLINDRFLIHLMKSLYSVLAILSAVIIIGTVTLTISSQQVWAPRACGGCAEFKKLTHEFENNVLDAAAMGNQDEISRLIDQYVSDVRAIDFTAGS